MSEGSRRRVSYTQLETLCEFLNEHREVATGYNKTAMARDTSKRMWQTIAQTLNAQDDGAIKDWKGWNRYWNDYKSKLKRSVASIRASQERTGGDPLDMNPLSDIERKFLQIFGKPFDQEPEIEMEMETETVFDELEENHLLIQNILPSSAQPVSSSSQSPSPSVQLQPAQLNPREQTNQTPRRRPRSRHQRRIRRREPPMSQESTRRSLIAISQQRVQIDHTRNELLRQLIQQIKDIKEMLGSRLPLPNTPVLDT